MLLSVVLMVYAIVKQNDSTQNAQPTPVLECHWKHSYLHITHIGVWTTQAIVQGQIFLGERHREHQSRFYQVGCSPPKT